MSHIVFNSTRIQFSIAVIDFPFWAKNDLWLTKMKLLFNTMLCSKLSSCNFNRRSVLYLMLSVWLRVHCTCWSSLFPVHFLLVSIQIDWSSSNSFKNNRNEFNSIQLIKSCVRALHAITPHSSYKIHDLITFLCIV